MKSDKVKAISDMLKENRSFLFREALNIVRNAQAMMKLHRKDYIEHGYDEPSIDVRLCVDFNNGEPNWIIRTGLVDYDQRHSDYCGASSIGPDTKAERLLSDLIDQVTDQVSVDTKLSFRLTKEIYE